MLDLTPHTAPCTHCPGTEAFSKDGSTWCVDCAMPVVKLCDDCDKPIADDICGGLCTDCYRAKYIDGQSDPATDYKRVIEGHCTSPYYLRGCDAG